MPDRQSDVRVEGEVAPHSYEVTTPNETLRCNRRALIEIPETPVRNETATQTETTEEQSMRKSGRVSRLPDRFEPIKFQTL